VKQGAKVYDICLFFLFLSFTVAGSDSALVEKGNKICRIRREKKKKNNKFGVFKRPPSAAVAALIDLPEMVRDISLEPWLLCTDSQRVGATLCSSVNDAKWPDFCCRNRFYFRLRSLVTYGWEM
jgi:hypothetical protein